MQQLLKLTLTDYYTYYYTYLLLHLLLHLHYTYYYTYYYTYLLLLTHTAYSSAKHLLALNKLKALIFLFAVD